MNPTWRVQVFFDGDCPLCLREINMLRALDRKQRIRFTDIADRDFDPEPWGRSLGALMAEIHGRLPGGEWITGVEVFRRMYSLVGLRPLLAWTRWPGLRRLADAAYAWFARNRLRLTGRSCSEQTCAVSG